MTLRLHDSRTQSIRDFVPLDANKVGMYVCGPTVQGAPHVGHLRSALVYDQLRRWLMAKGQEVILVRNVTDIDDKVLANAQATQEHWWALAYRYELEFSAAYSALNILPPTYEPRATASIPEMLKLIDRLIASGYAYQAEDGSANVYFNARDWQEYGSLTNQRIDDMEPTDPDEARGKRDSYDFALWKAHKPTEPESAAWDSAFGLGRPGWHIECSAMATKYLGSNFDIHGGGLDLRFPHHENELAQSSAAGDKFANYWLHNGLVNVSGQKMSKSLGNSIFAADLLAAAEPAVVRYYLGSAHYRSVLDYHDGVLEEAQAALNRVRGFIAKATAVAPQTQLPDNIMSALPQDFVAAMDNDLAIPEALAVLHSTVREGNSALAANQRDELVPKLTQVQAMLTVLGLELAPAQSAANQVLADLVGALLAERSQARANKDFARSDQIRDLLKSASISIEDNADHTNWSID
ncbi:cysteine--tRNA ligase [Candidatus Rhodoluna planktonica]|uniref:Cysteine--tRNA ligase n=1 Tax=Candidatus Rhodoluna planktonica TaxID=535712 RepID=A0A1D9DY47_9MICO|nr:cysteine--tRNA ligase [Candidatus Rhodoluna planktonica]AOY55726.1 cysteine--tRNA ligase [Candidatus Rhodoluna planktonica]